MSEDSLQRRLDAQRETSAAKRPAEINDAIARAIDRLRASGLGERAPRAGDAAPDFELPNAIGGRVRLGGLLERGPVVLAFYRGGW
jgi:hypothetical protein